MAKQKIQGEGDYEATRRYRKRTDEYLKNNDVEKAAVRAAPESQREPAFVSDEPEALEGPSDTQNFK